jgi:hypothetical protein
MIHSRSTCSTRTGFFIAVFAAVVLAAVVGTASAKSGSHPQTQTVTPAKKPQGRADHANGSFMRAGPSKMKCDMDKCDSK